MAKQPNTKWQKIVAITFLIIAAMALGTYIWCQQVYLKPQNVFWGSIEQNLQTGSITKTTMQKNSEFQGIEQASTIQFKGRIFSQTTITIEDKTKDNASLVITKTFGTPTQDFLMYKKIESKNSITPKNVEGVWAVNTATNQQQVQILADNLLSSPIIFGYLNSNKRSDLINQMKTKKVFSIDYKSVNKSDKVGNNKAYSYKISINLVDYISVYRNYLSMIGQGNLANQLGQPPAGSNYKAVLYINPITRHPLKLVPDGATEGETFSNFDINNIVQPPQNIKMPITELQKRIAQ